jgi:dienelactone hydrolase
MYLPRYVHPRPKFAVAVWFLMMSASGFAQATTAAAQNTEVLPTARIISETVTLNIADVAAVVAGGGSAAITPGARQITVSIVRTDRPGRHPFLVLEHGRAGDAAERARLALPIYPANARYFAAHGFIVLTPLRAGYGSAQGPDLEFTGECADKHFAAGVAPAVKETRALLEFAASLPYVDAHRGLIVGESFGGLVAVAAAAARLPGVLGVVNVAGGDGGDSLHRPEQPCGADRMSASFAAYGANSRLPTLWLYSANDRLWGTDYPKQWFTAFTSAGGHGEFVLLPADKNNGHYIFNRNAEAWHSAFQRFIATLGFAPNE